MVVAEDEEKRIQVVKSTVGHDEKTVMWRRSRVQSLPRKGQVDTSQVRRGCTTQRAAKENM